MLVKRKFKLSLIIACIFMLLFGPVAKAAPANPDDISNNSGKVFEDVFESGDMLFILESEIDYASEPDEDPEDAFQTLVKNNAETTLFGSRGARRYQWAFNSVYFSASEVTSNSMVSESEYKLIISGNPAMFPSIVEGTNKATLTLSSSDWSTDLDELEEYIINVASRIETAESLTLLTTNLDGDDILNATGTAIVLNAIPGINSIIPRIFQVTTSEGSFPETTGTAALEQSTTLTTKLGTNVASAFSGIGDFLGIDQELSAGLWILLFALTVASIAFISSGNSGVGIILAIPIIFIGAYLGALPMAMIYTVSFALVSYVAYFIWMRGT